MLVGFLKKIYQTYFLEKINDITAKQHDILAMQYLTPLSINYLPWSESAIRPSGLVAILNEISFKSYSTVVELGGGISTFYISRLLKKQGGRLLVFEHDEQWANILIKNLAEQNLLEVVSVVIAPLSKIELDNYVGDWYDLEIVKKKLEGTCVDLVLVDGPPAYTQKIAKSRYPAAIILREYLSLDYTIVLDDINREGEQYIVKMWEKFLGIKFEIRLVNGGISIGRSKSGLTV
jgi:hypothetical protein